MVLERSRFPLWFLLTTTLAYCSPLCGQDDAEAPLRGQVRITLGGYLDLVNEVEAAQLARRQATARREPSVAEITRQTTSMRIEAGGAVELRAHFEVEVRGAALEPVPLPLTGLPESVAITPPDVAAVASYGSKLHLVAPDPGTYQVDIVSRSTLTESSGVLSLPIDASPAPVAVTEIDLPAELEWACPGAVVVEEREAEERRHLRLALERGASHELTLRRRLRGAAEESTLARSVVVSVFDFRPVGSRRHDVVLYEVARGGLSRLAVTLPSPARFNEIATDEGEAVASLEDGRLSVERRSVLRSVGFVRLSSEVQLSDSLALDAVEPDVEPRAHYLVVASAVAATLTPLPSEDWERVDLDDLPSQLQDAVGQLDATAAWRRRKARSTALLRVDRLPEVSALATLVAKRNTTSLLTVDGSLVHRDEIVLGPSDSALEVTLPAEATLWSTRVDGQLVRPVEDGGKLLVPLDLGRGTRHQVEVVSVLPRHLGRGRTALELSLPRLKAPVLKHQWRLLLPEDHRYRFEAGSLRPAVDPMAMARSSSAGRYKFTHLTPIGGSGGTLSGQVMDSQGTALPGATVRVFAEHGARTAITDDTGHYVVRKVPAGTYSFVAQLEGFSESRGKVTLQDGVELGINMLLPLESEETIVVTSQAAGVDHYNVSYYGAVREQDRRESAERREAQQRLFRDAVESLRQGTVGGVRPLGVEIPETGKVLLMSGVLPPAAVSVELTVRPGKKN